MRKKESFYLVERSVLPEIFLKVVETKRLLNSGEAKTIHAAVLKTGISRSAYYKYKDGVEPFSDAVLDRIVTLLIHVLDEPGVLSAILLRIANSGANVLTINQNIPVNGSADITISLRTGQMSLSFESLIKRLKAVPGVSRVSVLSGER